jgi:hypothetical protein
MCCVLPSVPDGQILGVVVSVCVVFARCVCASELALSATELFVLCFPSVQTGKSMWFKLTFAFAVLSVSLCLCVCVCLVVKE